MTSKDLTVIGKEGGALVERPVDTARLLAQWKAGRSPETVRAYEGDIAHFAAWAGDPDGVAALEKLLKLQAGRANEIAYDYRAAMVDAGAAPSTINRRLSALRSLMSIGKLFGAINWELQVENVEAQAYRDTAGPGQANVIRVLQLAASHPQRSKALRDVAIVTLMYTLGLRRAEVVRLDLADVDLHAGKISVLRKRRREKANKSLPLPAIKALRSWIAARGKEPGPLFCSYRNGVPQGRLTSDGVHDMMASWGEELGIVLRPHGIRHTAITDVLDASKGDLRAARRFSDHKKVDTLLIYDDNRADLGGDLAKKIASNIASVIDGMGDGE
jgi:integrase/recombinase XerC